MVRKLYINVVAEFTASGHLEPLSITLYDGRCLPVERVLDVRNCANLKVGGAGIKYTCMIAGQQRSLWLENGNRWFVEEQVDEDIA